MNTNHNHTIRCTTIRVPFDSMRERNEWLAQSASNVTVQWDDKSVKGSGVLMLDDKLVGLVYRLSVHIFLD